MNKLLFGVITIAVAVPAFFLARVFWPFPLAVSGDSLAFFTLATAGESVLLGFGAAFALLVLVRRRSVAARWNIIDWVTFLSIGWILISGYPHDNIHIASGADVHNLIFVEIVFHGTLAVAAVVVAIAFMVNQK